jgi:2-dehydropantoate 2-reductase
MNTAVTKVQKPILILGNGRAASHLDHYLSLLGISHHWWKNARALNPAFAELASQSHSILLLVADSAIASVAANVTSAVFAETCPRLIHFSGSQVIPGIVGAHPLFPFTWELYDETTYRQIPFVIENTVSLVFPVGRFEQSEGSDDAMASVTSLSDLIPGLPNPFSFIDAKDRAFYHALCVAAGNFTTLLWQASFERFEGRLGLPAPTLFPYLEQISKNLQNDWRHALTGPLTRGDSQTIEAHLAAFEGDPLRKIYEEFISLHQDTSANQGERNLHS